MDRIFPAEHTATLIANGTYTTTRCVSELGIFGYILTDKDGKTVDSQEIGNTLRTKSSIMDEGGVSSGSSCIDAPYLFDGTDEAYLQGNIFK